MVSYKVSIIIPVFNEEKNICRVLDSVYSQTYKNFEVIVVDDGSEDNTGQICQNYNQKYNNFKYVYKKNTGVSDTRNLGLAYVTGDYVSFWDADDWVASDYLDNLVHAINVTPDPQKTVIVAGCTIDYYFNNSKRNSEIISLNNKLISKKEVLSTFIEQHEKYRLELWNKLFPVGIVKNKKFKSEIILGEDFEFFTQCLTNIEYLMTVNDTSYHYKIDISRMKHFTSFSQEISREKIIQKNLVTAGISKKSSEFFYFRRLLITAYTALSYLPYTEKNDKKEEYTVLKELKISKPDGFKPFAKYQKAQWVMMILARLNSPILISEYFKIKSKIKG